MEVPSPEIMQPPQVVLGDSVLLTCPLMGHPTPTYKWYLQQGLHSQPFTPPDLTNVTSQTLSIARLTRHHLGCYTCSANNTMGIKVINLCHPPFYIPVKTSCHFAENARVTVSDNHTCAADGSILQISCLWESIINPKVVWTRNSIPVAMETNITVDRPACQGSSTLTFRNVSRETEGIYFCNVYTISKLFRAAVNITLCNTASKCIH